MIELEPVGSVRTQAAEVPRSWTISDVVGELLIDKKYSQE
jgi:hypothetical protein